MAKFSRNGKTALRQWRAWYAKARAGQIEFAPPVKKPWQPAFRWRPVAPADRVVEQPAINRG